MFIELNTKEVLNVARLQQILIEEENTKNVRYYIANDEDVIEEFETELEAIARVQEVKELILLPWCKG